jgi:hypothetical protein
VRVLIFDRHYFFSHVCSWFPLPDKSDLVSENHFQLICSVRVYESIHVGEICILSSVNDLSDAGFGFFVV